jgi:hypothetical protein
MSIKRKLQFKSLAAIKTSSRLGLSVDDGRGGKDTAGISITVVAPGDETTEMATTT